MFLMLNLFLVLPVRILSRYICKRIYLFWYMNILVYGNPNKQTSPSAPCLRTVTVMHGSATPIEVVGSIKARAEGTNLLLVVIQLTS